MTAAPGGGGVVRLAAHERAAAEQDYCLRSCIRTLEQRGITVSFAMRSVSIEGDFWTLLDGDKDRYLYLAADTILTGLRAANWGEWKLACRCWAQACEYRGRHGGFLPSHLSDALGELRNRCESVLPADPPIRSAASEVTP